MSMGNRPSFSREAQFQWAGSRETNLASGRGGTFFLTSPFIELIDLHTAYWIESGLLNGSGTVVVTVSVLPRAACARWSSSIAIAFRTSPAAVLM